MLISVGVVTPAVQRTATGSGTPFAAPPFISAFSLLVGLAMGTLALPCRTTRGEATASHAAVFWLPWNKSGNLASLLESWAAVPAAARWDPVLHLANPRYVMFTHTIQFHAAPPWLSQDRGPAAPNNAPL